MEREAPAPPRGVGRLSGPPLGCSWLQGPAPEGPGAGERGSPGAAGGDACGRWRKLSSVPGARLVQSLSGEPLGRRDLPAIPVKRLRTLPRLRA